MDATSSAIVEALIRKMRKTAKAIGLSAAAADDEVVVRLPCVYHALAKTFDLTVRFIRAYRRQLMNDRNAIFVHRRSVGDEHRDHVSLYDHGPSEFDLISRCTVVAVEYTRLLVAQAVRSFVRGEKSSYGEQRGSNHRRRVARSFFTYVHKKIVTRATRLVVQSTLNRRPVEQQESSPLSSQQHVLTCYVCSRSFDKTFHYLQHIRVHYRLNLYLCVHCRESFVQQNGLNYHVRHCCPMRTTREPPPPYDVFAAAENAATSVTVNRSSSADCPHYELCDTCGIFFENGRCLRNHILRKHASRNADLGVNRTQQEYLRQILKSM